MDALTTDKLIVQDDAAPYRIETGTLNHPAIEGVGAAVDYLARFGRGATRKETVHDAIAAIAVYEHELGAYLWSALEELPGCSFVGRELLQAAARADGVVHRRWRRSRLHGEVLGQGGICVWDGSFYAPRPVDILNIPGGSLLRVGFSMYNTKEEAERLVKCVAALAPKK